MGTLGRTRLLTRRDRRRIAAVIWAAALGAALTVGLATAGLSTLAGRGHRLPRVRARSVLPPLDEPGSPGPRLPVTVDWPVPPQWTILAAAPLWLTWLALVVRPILRGLRRDDRHRGLASPAALRRQLGRRQVRRTGVYTLPGTSRLHRFLLPTSTFGFQLGTPLYPRTRKQLWASWEQRIRLIARPGWGKTTRLLIPIIRTLPGATLVSSTEPAIFTHTVLARQRPAATRWWRWLPAPPGTSAAPERPVAVVDFSDPGRRFAAGYPAVQWNPIPECDDFAIAHRRAAALIAGAIPTDNARADSDRFWRNSATEVLAAWLHAAALGDLGIDDLLRWLSKPTDPTPTRLLEHDPRAEPSAVINLRKHLDPRADKTSSGVERYLTLTMNALATADGRRFCQPPPDPATGQPAQFDMAAFIREHGTVYVLADASRIDRVRPLLSLFTAEMFLAAEHLALQQPHHRLPRPFIAVLDELRHGVTVPNLPYVATGQRKYGISYIYAVQSATQEDTLYGPDAQALRDAAGITIVGGIDITTARELTDRAGTTPVITPTRHTNQRGEQLQFQPALTIADQQRLTDGQAVITARGLPPFLATIRSIHDHPATARGLHREAAAVRRTVTAAQRADATVRQCHLDAARAGADFEGTAAP